MSRTQRTLGPAAFEAYMNFADSLKDGTNDDSIDRFKYRFAVKEGYIRPKKKTITESACKMSLGDFEKAFSGLVGAFLPHMDEDDQEILSRVCANLDEKISSGDMGGAEDVIKGAMRDAGGDPDECDADECDECSDDSECPEGETCVDGECKPNDDGAAEECACKPNSDKAKTECGGKSKKLTECNDAPNAAPMQGEGIGSRTPGFGSDDDTEFDLGDETGSELGDTFADNYDMDDGVGGRIDNPDEVYSANYVDYDALADELLRSHGYDNLTKIH